MAAKKITNKITLLSGGNPQIPMGYGDAPVQAYIAAMPGWKSDVGRRVDTLIERTVSGVHKAIKWNSPFYGVADDGVADDGGAQLNPLPPRPSTAENVRCLDIYENEFDEAQFVEWITQASRLPGTKM